MFTLQFATYTFPNKTFEIEGHRLEADVPTYDVRRYDGGVTLRGYLSSKSIKINGKIYGKNIDSVHNSLNIFKKSIHNKGNQDYFKYRDDRRILCRLSKEGIDATYEQGLYEYLINVAFSFVAERPYAEATSLLNATGSRTNTSEIVGLTNNGNFPTNPIFTFVAGTWNFQNDITVQNVGNSLSFTYQGVITAGQTLVIDCDAGCVLLQDGLTMLDAISWFGGDLFFSLEEGVNNVVVNAATLNFSVDYRSRWYV